MEQAQKTAESPPMPTSPEQLMARLRDLAIGFTLHRHAAMFTVADGAAIERNIEGTHCRNLFLRDKKKNNFLLVLQNATDVDIKKLPPLIGADRLSFGSAERLWEYLGVKPGSVCPFAIMNDMGKNVKILLDKSMMETDIVNYHPLVNTMTIGVKPADLLKFIENTGHEAHIVDLAPAKPDKEE